MEKISYQVGDIVRMKKPHPCGSHEWQILRTGMDFRLKCRGCGHLVMLPRTQFEKMARGKAGTAVEAPGE
ncbi:MAG TPA: DUF951 domain-containing protein [Selenomonas sp.]|nr:DUF951 domain-containing protein [Selenomonadaceae bacterium]HCB93378.1 DUF951 domain-containing protein [Selenomonas sp.]